jgi:hypothetical protein
MAVTQIIIEGGQGCECAPDRVVGQPPALQMIAPGEDVRPGHLPELVNTAEAGKGEELPGSVLKVEMACDCCHTKPRLDSVHK